jgi:hypothetical protein
MLDITRFLQPAKDYVTQGVQFGFYASKGKTVL